MKRIGALLSLLIMLMGFSVYAHGALVVRTGQTKCYDLAGAEINCAGTGQDGEIQAGVTWPDPRFKDNDDGIVTDNLTGLQWTKDAGMPTFGLCTGGTQASWTAALDYVKCLNDNNYLNHNDWHLPNINELESLINAEEPRTDLWLMTQGFSNVQDGYTSSTTLAQDINLMWSVAIWSGEVGHGSKNNTANVWPVRSEQSGLIGNSVIWKTGQTTSYYANDDGALQEGASWPHPRFTKSGNGTVLDNLTGLIWLENANCFGTKTWDQALIDSSNLANGQCNLTDGSQAGDWRLPNRKELFSLVDFQFISFSNSEGTGNWTQGDPFNNVVIYGYYWSSTTHSYGQGLSTYPPGYAWYVATWGHVDGWSKTTATYVWPVRGGLIVNTPPKAVCKNVTVSAQSGLCEANASIDNGSYDPDGDPIALLPSFAGPYLLGDTTVTLTVTDSSGASSKCTGIVTVVDNTPPTINNVSVNPATLLSPNHKMVAVTASASAMDNCSTTPVCKLSSVTSNEPVDDPGRERVPDWEITGDLTANLRAEHSAKGSGRIYTLTVACTDASGNSSSMNTMVTVPKQ